ncbi:19187_t:CDS:2, partial [Entrophospora sp. SA101]
ENCQFSDIAFLYRNNYLSMRIEQELIAQKIPYEILGAFKFIERGEIKDVLAFLRTILYQDNLSLLRVLNLMEGIGARTIEKIEYFLIAFEDKKLIKTRNNLILSSIHQAKGLEFEIVFFVYLDEGTLPYKENKDLIEEKRLFYVEIELEEYKKLEKKLEKLSETAKKADEKIKQLMESFERSNNCIIELVEERKIKDKYIGLLEEENKRLNKNVKKAEL